MFFGKLLSLFLLVKFRHIPGPQRWFIRLGYLARIKQTKYIFNDYYLRKPYKVISFKGEFQQELIRVLPHAYWHYKNGTLKETIACEFTAPFYYFSPSHREYFAERDYLDNESTEFPNSAHNIKIDERKWTPPPFSDFYKNNIFRFSKPILVIANRYNTEWQEGPISFFSIEFLDIIINKLKPKYQIVYNRPSASHIANDNSIIKELKDLEFIQSNHSEVLLMEDLYNEYQGKVATSFNHLQLLVYANCNNFLSIHGGTAALASYFGGINIIYSVQGHEHPLNEFSTFEKLAGTQVRVGTDYKTIDLLVDEYFLKE